MKSYKHLYDSKEDDSYDNILTKNIPSVALRNALTSNIILSMESLLVTGFKRIKLQTKYFSH